jgi:hypothetical protein
MTYDRDNARVAEEHFIDTLCRRISLKGSQNVTFEKRPHIRQICGELACDPARPLLALQTAVVRQNGCKFQFPAHLFKEGLQHSIKRAPDEIIDFFLSERRGTEMPWKKRRGQTLQNQGQRFLRWQLVGHAIGFCVLPPLTA